MLKITAFRKGRPIRNISVRNVRALASGENTVWVDIERGTRKDLEFVAKSFGLHPLTVEDMKRSNSLPKVDMVNGAYTMVIFHEAYYDRHVRKIKTSEIDFCIGRNFIVTVHLAAMKNVEDVRRKLMSGVYQKITPDRIMYRIMDLEVDCYNDLMNQLDDEIEDLEDKLLRGKGERTLHILSDHRREVTDLRRIVGPQRDILNKLSRGEVKFVSKEMLFYYKDIYDHIFRFYTSLEAHRDLITSAFETYTSIQSNNINKVVKQLSIISTVFLPLTFIVGIYGMNFRVMPELDNEYGYFAVLLVLAAVGTGMFVYFRKKYR